MKLKDLIYANYNLNCVIDIYYSRSLNNNVEDILLLCACRMLLDSFNRQTDNLLLYKKFQREFIFMHHLAGEL